MLSRRVAEALGIGPVWFLRGEGGETGEQSSPEAAVQELGYMPNLAASALASASSWTIAMVVPNLSEAGCSEMFAGLQQVLQPAGYQIMLAESQHRLEQEEKLLETLHAKGVEEITAIGKELDTDLHEAVAKFPVSDEKKGKIIDVVQKGYKLKDKVVRFAKVVVGE